jgi:hypothetical protein
VLLLPLRLQAANNNFDPVPVKNSSRGMSYLRRAAAAPMKPKSPMAARYHPYHMGASSAVLAAASQPAAGNGLGRVPGSSVSSSAMAASYAAKQHTSYAAFASLPRPHSSQSMGAMDGYTLAGGLRGSAAAAAGLPSSLLSYGGLGAAAYGNCSMPGQGMLPEQLLRIPSSIKQDPHQLQLGDAGLTDPAAAAAGMYSSYTAGSSFAGLPGGTVAGDWQASSASPAVHLAAGLEEGVMRVPNRLQHAGLPDLSMPVQRGNSLSFPGGQQGLVQQVLQQQHQQSQQHQGLDTSSKMQSSNHIGLPVFDKMPSLPDPAAQPGILDGCGDGDGTSLRGIFSSDDGEPFNGSHQQPGLAGADMQLPLLQQQGSGSQQMQQSRQFLGGCMDLAVAAAMAATSSQQHGSPTGQQLHAGAYASPNSFTSGCSPVPLTQSMLMQQQPQQHASAAAAAAAPAAGAAAAGSKHGMQLKIECTAGAAGYDTTVVTGGERGALSAPCTVTAAYTPSGYNQQQQQHMLPQGAFTQGGQQQQQQGSLPQMCNQQQGRYTPFQHPENQQQHMNHICPDQGGAAQQQQQQKQQQPAAAYQPGQVGGLPGYDSGNSSHHHQQQPGQGLPSPSTIAGSAAAAVARGCGLPGAAAQSWGSSPTSIAAHQQHEHLPQMMQQLHAHHLIAQVVSDDQDHDLNGLVDLLDAGDGDCSGDGCGGHHTDHHGLVHVDGDCGLMLSDGDFDDDALPADYLPGLPGLKRQSSELEMLAAAACW